MALVALGELGGDEFGGGAGDDLLAEAAHGRVEQRLVAPQPARLEEGGADRHVLLRERDQLGDRADRMADLELQVPQQVKHRLRRALLLGVGAFARQEHQVEVAEGRHLAAAGPAEPDERDPGRRLVQDALGDEVVGEADELVVEEGGRLRGSAAIARLSERDAGRFPRGRPSSASQRISVASAVSRLPRGSPASRSASARRSMIAR